MKFSPGAKALWLAAIVAGLAVNGWGQETSTQKEAPASAAPSAAAKQLAAPQPRLPEVHADGTVTFTFVAQNAQDVKVQIEGQAAPAEMTRRADGVWSFTSGVMAPELYGYTYIVDGGVATDPANRWSTANLLYAESLFEVPGRGPQPWDWTNVPHGAVTRVYYHSTVVGDDRDYLVYTPPGYDGQGSERYPVLYLLHGYSEGANTWTEMGKVNFILDNLISQGKAKAMIVVMPLGYGDPSILHPTSGHQSFGELSRNDTKFKTALLAEVMPAVERDYRVKTGAKNTAFAGLSMGGREALYVGVSEPRKFGYVVAMSAAPVPLGDARAEWQWKEKRELLWIGCGEQDPLVGQANQQLDAWLKAQGVEATVVWTPGMHTWMVWRENLAAVAPLLFR
jgi:enterochelin esterase-like enzyme